MRRILMMALLVSLGGFAGGALAQEQAGRPPGDERAREPARDDDRMRGGERDEDRPPPRARERGERPDADGAPEGRRPHDGRRERPDLGVEGRGRPRAGHERELFREFLEWRARREHRMHRRGPMREHAQPGFDRRGPEGPGMRGPRDRGFGAREFGPRGAEGFRGGPGPRLFDGPRGGRGPDFDGPPMQGPRGLREGRDFDGPRGRRPEGPFGDERAPGPMGRGDRGEPMRPPHPPRFDERDRPDDMMPPPRRGRPNDRLDEGPGNGGDAPRTRAAPRPPG